MPAALLDRIVRAAAAAPDREVCGLLTGDGERIAEALPAANVDPWPAAAFEIDPAALIAAHRAERAGGPRVMGCYHSHPRGPAIPSPRDTAAAEPGRWWLIVAAGEVRLWQRGQDGFREEPIVAAG